MPKQYSRHIQFEAILNFRDLGGYKGRGGRKIAWRRVFRSGEMYLMTERDTARLKEELGITSVIDLRSSKRQEKTGVGPLSKIGVKYYSVPFNMIIEGDIDKGLLQSFSNSGEIYYYRIRLKEYGRNLIEALEIIAAPQNHPLVFHCNAGKDRSGILTAILLGALGAADEDIIKDYTLTEQFMKEFIDRWNNDTETAEVHKKLPAFQLKAAPESMALLLTMLKKEYGSIQGYLKAQGAEPSLIRRLETALLA